MGLEDVEMIFAVSPPRAGRPGRLAASRLRACLVATVAAGVAAVVVVALALVLFR
jgi:hypothetical protein